MMSTTPSPESHIQADVRLEMMITRLEEGRGDETHRTHYERVLPRARMLLQQICLIHGVVDRRRFEAIVRTGELRSKRLLESIPSTAQEQLGTDQDVCTSAGILYPNRPFAFLFSHRAEAGRDVEASPFDSAKFLKGKLVPHLTGATREQFFQAHSLPTPHYREYLVTFVASCFDSPEAWLSQRRHRFIDPEGILSEDPLSGVFEVRFRERLPLDSHLEAVFLPGIRDDLGNQAILDEVEHLVTQGVEICYYEDAREELRARMRQWVIEHLPREGML